MALVVNDRVKETSTTTGTGTFTLDGAVLGFETFSSAIGNTNTTYYSIANENGEFEVGLGTVAAGTLARTTIISSSNSDSAVNFSAGTKDVFCTLPASKSVILDSSGNIVANNGSNLTNLNADNLASGTVPDARFPATLPAANGSALTDLNATNLASGTVPDARLSSSVATLNDSQTLTNKTLTDAVAITNSVTGEIVPGKIGGTNFTDSLLVGHTTTGTLNAADYNVGVGIEALDALTSGDYNTAIGNRTMTDANTGSENTAIGSLSLFDLTSGSYNTAVGRLTLRYVTGAQKNTAIGYRSHENGNGSNNTALGYKSGGGNSMSGSYNTSIGYQAGLTITSGNANLSIGNQAEPLSVTGDNQLTIGTYDGSTTTTWIRGDSNGAITFNGAYTFPTADGSANQILKTDGSGNVSFADAAVGDITAVTAGSGLTGGGTTGDVTLNVGAGALIDVTADAIDVDLSELTTSTSDADGDFFAVIDSANAQKKLTKSNINISGFNNDSGFTTNTGTVTSVGVTAGSGLTGGGTVTTSGTINLDVGAGTGIDVAADAISVDVSDFMTNGSNNRVLTATGTDAMNAEANLVFDGNLGVGTASPSQTLDVSGSGARIYITDANEDISMDNSGNGQISIDGNGYNAGIALDADAMNIYTNSAVRDVVLGVNETEILRAKPTGVDVTGHVVPGATDTYDLGASGNVWRNLYTGDLHLSNEGKSEGNTVDGTKGNWTIQEGAEDLYILNNKSGKKYKFKLEEI